MSNVELIAIIVRCKSIPLIAQHLILLSRDSNSQQKISFRHHTPHNAILVYLQNIFTRHCTEKNIIKQHKTDYAKNYLDSL
jgi:hypothetical protein